MQTSTDSRRALAVAKDFFVFVKHPTRRHPRRAGVKARASAIFTVLVFKALFTLLAIAPMMLILHRTIGLSSRLDLGTGGLLFVAVAFAPVMEELAFRAGLRSARWTLLGMPTISTAFWPDSRITLFIAGLTFAIWQIDRMHQRRLSAEALTSSHWKRGRAFIRHYALVVRISACLFAAAHLPNFVVDAGIGWKSVFLVLAVTSQLMSGLALSYLRLRYGLPSAIAAHFSWNALVVGMSLLGW